MLRCCQTRSAAWARTKIKNTNTKKIMLTLPDAHRGVGAFGTKKNADTRKNKTDTA
jgi:hypothetical protein